MICSTKVCSHCNEIISNNVGSGIGGGESKHQEHVCNPDAVASYKLIREETKPHEADRHPADTPEDRIRK